MKMYRRPLGDDSIYLDYADYAEDTSFLTIDGWEWMEGEPPETAQVYRELTLLERLKTLMLELPDTVQAQLGPLAASVDLALRNGVPNVAKLTIENAQIPEELEASRQAMLAQFPPM